MKTFGILLAAAVFALLVNGSWAWSQQIQVAPAMAVAGQQLDFAAAMKEQLAQQKKVWQTEMTVLLADVDRVCTLTSEQKAKLEVAAKGAIEKSFQLVKAEQEQMMAQFGQMGAVVGDRVDRVENVEQAEERGDDETKETEEQGGNATGAAQLDVEFGGAGIAVQAAAGQVVQFRMAAPAAVGVSNSHNPADQEIWKKTIKLTLSAEQNNRYDDVVKTRATQAQEARLTAFMSRVNTKLLLAPEQVVSLRELVAKSYGDTELDQASPEFAGIMINGMAENSEPFVKEVAKVLSPAQLELWQANFQSGLDFAKIRQGRMGGRAMFFPAMPLAPAIPVNDK